MTVVSFDQASRRGEPALIGIWGKSGSGKTYSALTLARGLVGESGNICLIDTERGRSQTYDYLVGGWSYGGLEPPFTPQRYQEAMDDAVATGADVIIFDSMSHVWEGEGGVLDMAEQGRSQAGKELKGLAKWRVPKMAYKRMMTAVLRTPVHVIFCLRSKEKFVQTKDGKLTSQGYVPICGKDFIYEMTLALEMQPDTHKPIITKCPEQLISAVPQNGPVTIETGQRVAEWVGGGAAVDEQAKELERVAQDIATLGTGRLEQYWKSLSPAQQKKLVALKAALKATAEQADIEADGEAEVIDDQRDKIT